MAWNYGGFPEYVPVAQRRVNALREMGKLRKQGQSIEPVALAGRAIARSFWGKGWCDHLESFSDFSNRLPRGRTYVRNGSVCHLAIRPGGLEAFVSGSELYTVKVHIDKLMPDAWRAIKLRCAGQVGSMLELLQGRLSDQVMTVVTDRAAGLFPQPGQIKLDCSCPDWASMCKHVAAVLYGVGSRLDNRPDLLFTLRGVDPQELIATELALPSARHAAVQTLADDQLSEIFDIELDHAVLPVPAQDPAPSAKAQKRQGKNPVQAVGPTPGGNGRQATTADRAPDRETHLPDIRITGKAIARLRRQLKLSAADFARQLGISAGSVQRWESTKGRLQLRSHSRRALAALRQKC
ncbi:MAG: SWIM zinc finger family protein [Phycisphaeraceae bacterium]